MKSVFRKFLAVLFLGALFIVPASILYAGLGTYPGTCPLMKGEKTKEKFSTEYQGKKIYFCCKRCVSKFQSDPERYIKEVA